jgi:hypothetical protein
MQNGTWTVGVVLLAGDANLFDYICEVPPLTNSTTPSMKLESSEVRFTLHAMNAGS